MRPIVSLGTERSSARYSERSKDSPALLAHAMNLQHDIAAFELVGLRWGTQDLACHPPARVTHPAVVTQPSGLCR